METAYRNGYYQDQNIIILYSLFESEQLSTHLKLTLHKALIRAVMTWAFSGREFTADTHLMKS
jgi:hypothetical protein